MKSVLYTSPESVDYLVFRCPGCRMDKYIPVSGPKKWAWNDSHEAPTLTPSILQTHRYEGEANQVCHSFVTDGRIQFLSDCTHDLAGKTVDLPERRS